MTATDTIPPHIAHPQLDYETAGPLHLDHQGSNIDQLRAELAAEFRDALLHAYHGPLVDMSHRQLPQAFEADERSDTTAPDILQLLSGRSGQT